MAAVGVVAFAKWAAIEVDVLNEPGDWAQLRAPVCKG